uniref:Uncharacterized protein n=1 Tax=Vespula pensylvanica TaxID=30213 RepID=A0A834P7S7_VESPE|nr:hypothetical protein H0235_006514 [Vespula pensylvanica]
MTVKLLARSARAEGEKVKPTARTSFFNGFESEEAAAKKFDLKGRKEKELGPCIFSSARERSVFLRPFVLLPLLLSPSTDLDFRVEKSLGKEEAEHSLVPEIGRVRRAREDCTKFKRERLVLEKRGIPG